MSQSQWQCFFLSIQSCSLSRFPTLCHQPQSVLALCWTFVPSISSWFQDQSCPSWRLVVTFLDLHSWIPGFPLSLLSVHTGSYFCKLGSPRDQHLGKRNHRLGVLIFPCIPMLTTQSSQCFGACSRRMFVLETLWSAIFGAHLSDSTF